MLCLCVSTRQKKKFKSFKNKIKYKQERLMGAMEKTKVKKRKKKILRKLTVLCCGKNVRGFHKWK